MHVMDIVEHVASLPVDERQAILEAVFGLSDRERKFVAEYVRTMNRTTAATAAGYENPHKGANALMNRGRVKDAIEAEIVDVERRSGLDAEYVREFMLSVLELCPTDYFELAPDGEWMIDPETFRQLPRDVKRLVDSVDLRYVGGRRYVSVKFISKSSVLAMAARYTLTQKIAATVVEVPWDRICGASGPTEAEKRLAELEKEM